MTTVVFIIILVVVFIVEYRTHCNALPFRIYKLKERALYQLEIKAIAREKRTFCIESRYLFKGVELRVSKQRFTLLNNVGSADVYKEGERVCSYSQLPLSFKTSMYSSYLVARYPKTISRLIYYSSTNKKTNFYDFCVKEELITFYGGNNNEKQANKTEPIS